VAGAVHAHPAAGHRLEQGALGAGAGPVDLIGEQHLGEQRSGLEVEAASGGIQHVDAGEIGRQQVAGEAHPAEGQPEAAGQGLGQGGLAGAGQVFQQQVAAGQHAGQGQSHALLLAEQYLADGLHQTVEGRRQRG
jgi:hypothetical protein